MTLYHGDCLEVMATFADESIDAIVTDPPYGLGFMGKAWDHGVPGVPFWAEMLRVAKPGAHLLAFGGTRTVHRIATAIEDAGWEIRDTLVWAYASGFPKSLDVSKAIDKHTSRDGTRRDAPATPDAEKWQGWGTALKPAWEPIVMARKPLRGTLAGNVLAHGTGALNIDGTRIGTAGGTTRTNGSNAGKARDTLHGGNFGVTDIGAGRWPANVILTDPIFDGDVPGVVGGGEATGLRGQNEGYGDSGTYSRFFLIPKAARSDREPILGGLPLRDAPKFDGGDFVNPAWGSDSKRPQRANVHPTVKPTELMRHLVRLVTPPGGVVLDPFLGSGTTAIAAEAEGFEWVGIEREAEYVAIAEARLNGTQRGLGLVG